MFLITSRPNLRALGIAGFKIPQWEVRGEQVTPGNEYERLSVATYTTHDHKPIRALWEDAFEHPTATSEQSRFDLAKIAVFAGFDPRIDRVDFEKDFYPAIMEALFGSEAWLAIVMITDLLARKYRFNVPGTKANLNWTRRMQRAVAQLISSRKEQKRMRLIHELLEKPDAFERGVDRSQFYCCSRDRRSRPRSAYSSDTGINDAGYRLIDRSC